jgi:penicillin-binding protein 2
VVAVLWEHGNWGNNSAKLAAQVINAYITKQRTGAGNLMKLADAPKAGETQAATPTATNATPASTSAAQPSGQ